MVVNLSPDGPIQKHVLWQHQEIAQRVKEKERFKGCCRIWSFIITLISIYKRVIIIDAKKVCKPPRPVPNLTPTKKYKIIKSKDQIFVLSCKKIDTNLTFFYAHYSLSLNGESFEFWTMVNLTCQKENWIPVHVI